jgi:hypothetical protein
MLKDKLFVFGKVIPDLELFGRPAPYPVVNEQAVRAGAGILFLLGIFAFFHAFYLEEYVYIQFIVVFFWFDFLMKSVVGTAFSPVSILAHRIVATQTPVYVGAIQKRFAWSIGFILASIMMILIFVFGIIGLPNLIICSICLTFMFMESAFSICVGCKIYNLLLAWGIVTMPVHKPVCAGNSCAIE